jgi:hypothetical protein
MIITSVIAGILSSMNIWVDKLKDINILNINEIYMISLMTLWMLILTMKMGWMLQIIIILMIIMVYIGIRRQIFVTDIEYIRGMITHHSMAILMSKGIRDRTKNDEIKKLAEGIIEEQEKEIKYMNRIIT